MILDKATFFHYNERSILIQFDVEINQKLLNNLLSFKNILFKSKPKQILQIINTYNSLLIIYGSTINNFYNEKNEVFQLLKTAKIEGKISSSVLQIPVCYDEEFGIDLHEISESKNMAISEIIKLHAEPNYLVHFIGFLPGFPYLSGLNSELFSRRKSQPRSKINAGAVGIGGEQTGIYPMSSPGGWQIIGQTPIQLFNQTKNESPSLLHSGDILKFEPISKSEYQHIENNLQDYELKKINL